MRLNDGDKKFGLTTPAAVFGHHGGAGAMVRCVSTFSCSMAIEARSARAIRYSSIHCVPWGAFLVYMAYIQAWADPESGISFVCLTTEPTMCYSPELNELSDLAYAAALAF